jgi:hypothetical protein
MNPFAPLQPALAALSDGPEILPATGQAQEYLQQFDVDEYYDGIRTEDDKKVSEVMESRLTGSTSTCRPCRAHSSTFSDISSTDRLRPSF